MKVSILTTVLLLLFSGSLSAKETLRARFSVGVEARNVVTGAVTQSMTPDVIREAELKFFKSEFANNCHFIIDRAAVEQEPTNVLGVQFHTKIEMTKSTGGCIGLPRRQSSGRRLQISVATLGLPTPAAATISLNLAKPENLAELGRVTVELPTFVQGDTEYKATLFIDKLEGIAE
jgi:hypothetical protein